ncbi:MAG: hypothetical protein WC796_05280 [Candidatus Pacearchaeota archaeon]|jgi:hypothetical protein
MAKSEVLRKILNVVIWLTGIIVSLAVAWAMITQVIKVPLVPQASIIAGWIVLITTILGLILAVIDYAS